MITGAVPGANGCYVVVRPAIKNQAAEPSQVSAAKLNYMAAKVLTVEAAKAANIDVVENGKYTQVVHDTVVALCAQLAAAAPPSTKTKATVNGSGAKPWRQKGTGRARAGYKSRPVWVGGGVVFGPHPRDYSKKVPSRCKRIALRKALSERIKAGDVYRRRALPSPSRRPRHFVQLVAGRSPGGRRRSSSPQPSTRPPTSPPAMSSRRC